MKCFFKLLTVFLICFAGMQFSSMGLCATAPVTLFAPGLPNPDKVASGKKKEPVPNNEGADIIISLVQPYEYTGRDMDRPQILGMYKLSPYSSNKSQERNFIDLLSDIEEIRYMDKKAWNININTEEPGLCQFVLETKPWWDERRNIFIQHQAKLLFPVLGIDEGWNISTGQSLEIIPMTNPFGLIAPALFAAKFLVDGKPAPDMQIIMGKLNSAREEVNNRWYEAMEARSDANGQFSFLLNKPGWWFCEARIPGSPLMGMDGEMKDLLRSTLLWVHVANPADTKYVKRTQKK